MSKLVIEPTSEGIELHLKFTITTDEKTYNVVYEYIETETLTLQSEGTFNSDENIMQNRESDWFNGIDWKLITKDAESEITINQLHYDWAAEKIFKQFMNAFKLNS